MEGTHMSITLEVDVDGDHLTGSLRDRAGADRDFCGWVGLVAALDALLTVEPSEREEIQR
jgi:hypothetical protein